MKCFISWYMTLRVRESCLSELADVTGQFKTTCVTLVNAVVAFGNLLRLDQCFKSLFIMFCLDLFLLTHIHFPLFKQLFKL